MKRSLILIFCVLLVTLAHAEEVTTSQPETPASEPEPLVALPRHQGYAVNQPTVLLRQRLFGMAHGLSLLAAACLDVPEHTTAVENAYAAWYGKQANAIKLLVTDLSRYHFGPRAEEAHWSDLTRVLKLKDSIQPSLKGVKLNDACQTLPQALTRQRYDFATLLSMPEQEVPAKEGNASPNPTDPRE